VTDIRSPPTCFATSPHTFVEATTVKRDELFERVFAGSAEAEHPASARAAAAVEAIAARVKTERFMEEGEPV
jgi:hypothetical protein